MRSDDDNSENGATQEPPTTRKKASAGATRAFTGAGPDYNSAESEAFVKAIFGTTDGVCLWASKSKAPGFPSDWGHFNGKSMSRSRTPKACYFGTARMALNSENQLRNRQISFAGLYCLVIDDVGAGAGSKCTLADLPAELRECASWIIETSPDNHQYGYVLDKPVTDLWQAKQLVRLVYGAGPWDSGGAMPNKLVRMPCGVNLKAAYRSDEGFFAVRLVADEFFEWTPQELLDASGADVAWSDIEAGSVDKIDPQRRRGATAYREGVQYEQQNGLVDEGLEWLSTEGWLLSEGEEWHTIRCPWHADHSEGAETAGYSPLGVGGELYRHSRGFRCFHSHCADRTIVDFLGWLATVGGPSLSVVDPKPEFISRFVHNVAAGTVVDVKSPRLAEYKYGNFKDAHQDPMWIYRSDGTAVKIPLFSYWNTNPNRIKVWGADYAPGVERIYSPATGEDDLLINSWSLPYWPSCTPDAAVLGEFIDFLQYLMPDDWLWFVGHLAMKAQNPVYRGPGVILSTPVQGTGRGRLEHCLSTLWGKWNVARVRLPEVVRGVNATVFNVWLCSSWLYISEAKDASMSVAQSARAYDALKDYVEPGAVEMLIKYKNGFEGMMTCYASVIVSTNHIAGLVVDEGDRRFKRIENCTQPRDAQFFIDLMAFFDSRGRELWHALLQYDVSGFDAYPNTQTDKSIADKAATVAELHGVGLDSAISWCLQWADEKCAGVILPGDVLASMQTFAFRFGFHKLGGDWEKVFHNGITERTRAFKRGKTTWQTKINGVILRPRQIMSRRGHETARELLNTGRAGAQLRKYYSVDSFDVWMDNKLKENGH